ncbi:unnamed protein product [Ostreobium quekettii]|uniref:Protein phosphatase n=1 Tax=Ostreobium quekettii TaxID=121088 RepID=A0A8S1J4A8_9CHLO|nr:unnamed protein product [Ostreobium quekettii]
MLSEAVSPLPIPPPGPIRTISILGGGLALILAISTAMTRFMGQKAEGERKAQQELVAQQASLWQGRLKESKREWQNRLEELRQQLEESHQKSLRSQLDVKDAQHAMQLLKTEKGVRREMEDVYKSKMKALRDEERAKVRLAEKKAEEAVERERASARELRRSVQKVEKMKAEEERTMRLLEEKVDDALVRKKRSEEQLQKNVEKLKTLEDDMKARVRLAEKRAEDALARERTAAEELKKSVDKMKTMKDDEKARVKRAEKIAEVALAREKATSEELKLQFSELQGLQKGLLDREDELNKKMESYEERLVAAGPQQADYELDAIRSSLEAAVGMTEPLPADGELRAVTDQDHLTDAAEVAGGEGTEEEYGATDGQIRIVAAGAMIPHILKTEKGGEDAFFVSVAGLGGFGIADGVGGWAADGIDPARYSRSLMSHAASRLEQNGRTSSALDVVEFAHRCTKSKGSATAIVAVMKPEGLLEIANIGDCGAHVFRGNRCVFSTKIQEHEFNMPYQLGDPAFLEETDMPSDATVDELALQPGDIVVMGSDGVFDNLWIDDIGKIVSESLTLSGGKLGEREARVLAQKITESANANARSTDTRTPWAVEAASRAEVPLFDRLFPRGGKMDDCTTVVGVVKSVHQK